MIKTLITFCLVMNSGVPNQPPNLILSRAGIDSIQSGIQEEVTERKPRPDNDQAFDPEYLSPVMDELKKSWPKNRTVRFVFHGHSVPAGYFQTPRIQRFDSYPILFQQQLCKHFPTSPIDVSITAIGGENSEKGAARFATDVLPLKPDVVFVDYALNDRSIGLERSESAWRRMIEACQAEKIRIVLLTPTPDSKENILDEKTPLNLHAQQILRLAREYQIPVADSYQSFRNQVSQGKDVSSFLSQPNHPNRAGHELVSERLLRLFERGRK